MCTMITSFIIGMLLYANAELAPVATVLVILVNALYAYIVMAHIVMA